MATEEDVYDVVLASSSYLHVFGKFSCRNKLDVDASGFTTCCVVEMTWLNMPDSYKNFGWTMTASTDTFGCQQSSLTMFWGWWDHTFYVYQLCTWLCMCRDARRRTHKSAQKSCMSRFLRFTAYGVVPSYDIARGVNATDTLHVFD